MLNKTLKGVVLLLICILLVGCARDSSFAQTTVEEAIEDTEVVVELESEVSTEPEVIYPIVSTVDMLMVGDNLIHSSVYKSGLQEDGTYNFDHLYENIKSDVEEADIAIINQETIFIEDKSKLSSYPCFGSPTEIGVAAVEAGFDVFAHATNHTLDKDLQGVYDTINFWDNNYPEVTYLGIHDSYDDSDIAYIEENGIKFAFVNYTYGLNGLESRRVGNTYVVDMLMDDDIEGTLAEAEENAEVTVAILHVGNEYVYEPTDYAQEQVARFINNGADIVLCAHPHVVEPYEFVTTDAGNTGLVFYSLGNYISSQDELPRIVGGMAKINITKREYESYAEVEITDYTMEPLVTHQEYRYYTTYKLEDYTDELCKRHTLYHKRKAFDCQYLRDFYDEIVGGE